MLDIPENIVSILTILNNINELIVRSSDRQGASEVMRALVVYADSKKIPVPIDKINNFKAILLDAKPYTLTTLIKSIAEEIVVTNSRKPKKIKN